MDYIGDQQSGLARNKGGLQWWVWALIAVLACCGLLCLGGIGSIAYAGQEPDNFTAEYSLPSIVSVGDEFELVITLTNTGSGPVMVNDIDLDEAFGGSILDGAIVLSTEPDMEKDYSLEGIKTFHFNQSMQPGETQAIIFHLQATTVGEFGGSVGIYVGDFAKRFDFVSIIVQE